MSLVDDIKLQFRSGNLLMQLIYVNSGVFILFILLQLIGFLFQTNFADALIRWFELPSNLGTLLLQPWSLVTHMFIHTGFSHVLFNMITLYFVGQIFKMFLSDRQLISTYFLGGLTGAVFYIIALNVFPVFTGINGMAMGASAAILAIMASIATLRPDFIVPMALIGPVRLKYIAMVFVGIDLIFLPGGNAGGHIGHLGGAVYGLFFGLQLRNGQDTSINLLSWIQAIKAAFTPKSKIKVVHTNTRSDENFNARKKARQEDIDNILDKISKSGYDSLSATEKETLFKASKDT